MQTSVDNPRIGVYSGSHTISTPLTFSGTTLVDSGPGTLTISSAADGAGGLTKSGSGTLVLSNTGNTYHGNTVVQGGILQITGGISPGSTPLLDLQSGQAVLKTTNVVNANLTVHTATGASFLLVNGTHTVGNITGTGSTVLNTTSQLTAGSITQSILTIGGSKATYSPGSEGFNYGSETPQPVPEPSFMVAAMGIAAAAICRKIFKTTKRRLPPE
jgi:autotransporter-associated beta strand protein